MDRRRLTGGIALVVVLLLIAGLIWYEASNRPVAPITASAPVAGGPAAPPAAVGAEQPPAPATASAEPPAAQPPQPGAASPAPAPAATADAAPPASAPGDSAGQLKSAADATSPAAQTPPAAAETAPPAAAEQPPTAAPAPPPAATTDVAKAEPPPAAAEQPAVAEPTPPSATTDVAKAEPPPAAAEEPAAAEPALPAVTADVAGPEPAPMETPPAAPDARPAPDSATSAVVPTFDVVRVDPTGEAVIAGLAEPNATVEVLDGSTPIATGEANDRGEWALQVDQALTAGTHDLSVRTTSKNRSITVLSDQRVAVEIPEAGSKGALVVLNAPDAASKVLQTPPEPPPASAEVAGAGLPPAATQPEQPAAAGPPVAAAPPPASAEVASAGPPPAATPPEQPAAAEPQVATATPPAAPAQPSAPTPLPQPSVSIASVEADTAGEFFVSGAAVTGDTVRVYLDDAAIGEASPVSAGSWSLKIQREVAPGSHRVRADQIGSDGGVVARAEVPFQREAVVATLQGNGPADSSGTAAPRKSGKVATVTIRRGDSLWRIARTTWGQGARWTTIYKANRKQIRNPRWIYPGQVFTMPKRPVARQK